MRLLCCSAGLALYMLLAAGCDSSPSGCDSTTTITESCQSVQCTGTLRDCKNGAADGCETDSATDINNCGACGNRCPTPASGEAVCVDGVCGASSCGTRYVDCNGSTVDGCEIDTFRDVNNCGFCGHVCPGGPNAAAACVAGKCQLACQASYLNCNNDSADGCEINGASDLDNCGSCGNECPPSGSNNVACAAGSCISTTCSGTFQTCKAGPVDSCETNTATSPAHCGICGKQCDTPANATPGCAASNCGIGTCNTGFDDCNKQLGDGCEINLTNDPAHCGMCGRACSFPSASATCAASSCTMGACNTNFANCNNDPVDGCEINTSNDVNNCGSCGNKCTSGACSGGKCVSCFPVGPQQNVPISAMIACGWTQCYLDNFNDSFSQSRLLTQCDKANVIEACRVTGAGSLQLMAQAPRGDVFFNTGDANNVVHQANGTNWYFSSNYSQGFAPMGSTVTRSECDVENGPQRMCIHTLLTITQGYRCGDQVNLQSGNTTYERIFFHQN